MFAEVPDAFVSICLVLIQAPVANVMRFVDDDKIEMRSRVKVKQSKLPASAMLFALIYATVQYGIRNDCFVVPDWPFFIPMGIGNGLPQDSTVQRNEVFIEPPHL